MKNIIFVALLATLNLSVLSKSNKLNDLVEISDFKTMVGPHPKAFARLIWYVKKHGHIPKMNRLLLYGPPGTGKSKYAEELAKSLHCNFLKVSASEFINRYIGAGAASVKDYFKKALCGGEGFYDFDPDLPTLLFIDEVDVITPKSGESGEYQQTAAALWTELDNVKGNGAILVVMATNNRDSIPVTILNRLGTNQVEVDLPDADKRRKLLDKYLGDNDHLKHNLELLIKKTKNMSSRSIEDACSQSIEAAAMDGVQLTEAIVLDHLKKIQNPSDLNFFERIYKRIGENKERLMLTTTMLSTVEVITRVVKNLMVERSVPAFNLIQSLPTK